MPRRKELSLLVGTEAAITTAHVAAVASTVATAVAAVTHVTMVQGLSHKHAADKARRCRARDADAAIIVAWAVAIAWAVAPRPPLDHDLPTVGQLLNVNHVRLLVAPIEEARRAGAEAHEEKHR